MPSLLSLILTLLLAAVGTLLLTLLISEQPQYGLRGQGARDRGGGRGVYGYGAGSEAEVGAGTVRTVDSVRADGTREVRLVGAKEGGEGAGKGKNAMDTSSGITSGGGSDIYTIIHPTNTTHPTTTTNPITTEPLSPPALDPITHLWASRLHRKLRCINMHIGGVFLYRSRRSAATSVREILTFGAAHWRVPYAETEGRELNPLFLNPKSGLLTVITLRPPLDRIKSLYWSEHVGWFDGVLHQRERCQTFRHWAEAWLDGAAWKQSFVSQNSLSNFVEIDNYYVKLLSQWHGRNQKHQGNWDLGDSTEGGGSGDEGRGEEGRGVGGGGGGGSRSLFSSRNVSSRAPLPLVPRSPLPVTAADLSLAKASLQNFDLLLLSEWMGAGTQVAAVNALFPDRGRIAVGNKMRGDKNKRTELTPTLAPDEHEVLLLLRGRNKWDLELYEYAQELMAYR
ncbi:hypothetical protein B484DRAFT_268964 [Ochromonadaceae sp. CCMP2298]|nr:hypothetical protein B484DRAFT_268964 [Ochromonadaceae sp. CCMP2298]